MARTPPLPPPVRRLPSGRGPRAAIRRYVRQLIERFHPQRVILFGSHAYGRPHEDSDDVRRCLPLSGGAFEQAAHRDGPQAVEQVRAEVRRRLGLRPRP
jgi:hypothetical protein